MAILTKSKNVFAQMAETESRRDIFSEAVLRLLIYFDFDGFDLDWEYPTQRRGLPEDRDNFSKLVRVLHSKLRHRNRILSVAVGAAKKIMAEAYDFNEICTYVDFVNVMGYDLNAHNETSAHAPLRKEPLFDGAARETLVIFDSFVLVQLR